MAAIILHVQHPLAMIKRILCILWSSAESGNFAGRDATDDFELVGHSTSAKDLMDKYYIGEIDASSMQVKFQHIPPSETSSYSPKKSNEFMLKTLEYLVPLAILAAAFAVPHCTRTE